ncbi:MAG: hypothetical protein SGI74_07955 [Oligoflexia bacterium]|nr:hypothetical protein [Oligoflexia bacterium]
MEKLIAFIIALSWGSQVFAAKLTKNQLDLVDPKFIEQKRLTCESARAKQTGVHEWLANELAAIGYSDSFKENTKTLKWMHDVLEFKVGGDNMEVQTLSSAPGTFGTINDSTIKFGNEESGKKLSGQLVFVGSGSLQELKSRDDLAGKIWLMEYRGQIANPLALVFEAKNKKAMAVAFYQNKKANELPLSTILLPLPVVFISSDDAEEIKIQLKQEPVSLSMSIRSDYPVSESADHFYVRRETKHVPVLVTADSRNCQSIAHLLGMLEWIKKSNVNLSRTSFLFSTNTEAFKRQHPEWFGRWAQDMPVESMASRDFKTLLVDWYKADQSAVGIKIDVASIFNKINQISMSMIGIVDGDNLKKFRENLNRVKAHPHVNILPQAYHVSQLLSPATQLQEMASDLSALKELHYLVRSGQWTKAKAECKKITGFNLVDHLSSATFVEFHSLRSPSVNPKIWLLLDEGKKNLDSVLSLIEKDIDALSKQMADYFLEIEKDIEKLSPRQVSSG